MPTYAQLNQIHPSINVARRKELCALYEGGEKIDRVVSSLLPQRPQEKPDRYALRLKETEYRNYLGPIIDYFASMLFVSRTVSKATSGEDEKPVEDPGEFWKLFREDCDRGGTDLDDFFKRTLTDAMVGGVGWLRLHHPTATDPVDNRADFEALGLNACWLEHIEQRAVLDWDTGDDGRLLWAVTHKLETRRDGLEGDRSRITETWHYLTPEAVDTYVLSYKASEPPKGDTPVPRIASEPHRFGRVPLVCIDLPRALWVADRLRSPQLAHFRKVCAQNWSLSTTAYAMPVVKVEDPDEYRKQTAGAGYEILIGSEDSYEWQAPPAEHFAALDTEIKAAKDEIFRIAHQMALGVENNAAAIGRSAESKASDAESTRVVLVAFSRLVRETIEYTLDLVAKARGEEYTWSVEGLDDFAALEESAFFENLKTLKDADRTIPSKTFQVALNERTAELILPHLDEATKAAIREEIKSGTADPVAEREEQKQIERDLALKAFEKPVGGGASGDKPANGAKPRAPNPRASESSQ